MNVPTIFDLLDRLAFLRGAPAVALVLALAALAVVAWDLRVACLALLGQYLVVGLLAVEVVDPRLAVVYLIGGLVTALMLLITGRQIHWGRPPAEPGRVRQIGRFTISDRAILRLVLAAAVLVAALWLYRTPGALLAALPNNRAFLEPAIVGLAELGLVGLALATEPLPSAIGLLLFISGFALYYSLLDPSIIPVVALVVLQLVVALVAAYLAQARRPAGAPE